MLAYLRQALLRPALPLLILLCLTVGGFVYLLDQATTRLERLHAEYARDLISTGLQVEQTSLVRTLRDYAIWNDMDQHVNTGGAPDMAWVRDNLTPSLYQNLRVDMALLLRSSMTPAFVLLDGQEKPAAQVTPLLQNAALQTLVNKAQHQAPYREDSVGIVVDGSRYLLVTVKAITQEPVPQHFRPKALLLFARTLDPAMLRDLAHRYQVRDLQLTSTRPATLTQIPLSDAQDHVVGYLSWRTELVGEALREELTTPLTVWVTAVLVCGLLLGALTLRVERSLATARRRQLKQGDTLQRLIRVSGSGPDVLQTRLRDVCAMVSETLDNRPVALWRFAKDYRELVCDMDHRAGSRGEMDGQTMDLDAHPRYREALLTRRTLAFDRIANEPVLDGFGPILQQRYGTTGLLDVTLLQQGKPIAVLCVEERSGRRWAPDELNFATAAADIMALMFESDARERAEQQLYQQFYFDPETGLPNVLHLRLTWQDLARHSRDSGQRYAYCLIDLSTLSDVTRHLGVDGTQQVVHQIAQEIGRDVREREAMARVDRQRFALLIRASDSIAVEERLVPLLARLRQPVGMAGHHFMLEVSIGVSLQGVDAGDFNSLQRNAEAALQQCGTRSTRGWALFDAAQEEAAKEEQRWRTDLMQAVDGEQLEVHYQPFYRADGRAVTGAEALLRWRHPRAGLVSPDRFIPLAEENGLIVPIGQWVIDRVTAQIARWHEQFGVWITVAINLSSPQLHLPDLPERLQEALARHSLPPKVLELELTESIMLEDSPQVAANLAKIRALGIPVAIDDFGAGYASFNYLLRFSVQKLKIDRVFTAGIPESEQHAKLVAMIVTMGRSLGLAVTGEGVERREQLDFLAEHGCDYVQGYYFSRPLPADQFAELLRGQNRVPA